MLNCSNAAQANAHSVYSGEIQGARNSCSTYKCKIYEEIKALEHQPTTRCCFDWISIDGRHAPPVNTLWVSGWRVS